MAFFLCSHLTEPSCRTLRQPVLPELASVRCAAVRTEALTSSSECKRMISEAAGPTDAQKGICSLPFGDISSGRCGRARL